MGAVQVFLYFYLGIGLIYAFWIWLFKGASFFSIPINTVLGPAYVFGVLLHFLTWRKKTIYSLFRGKRAVIFDLDGTIVDSQPFWNEAMENIKKKIGLSDLERNYPSGLNSADKWANLLRGYKGPVKYPVKDLAKMTNDEFLRIYTDGEVHDGFWSLLRYLKEKGFKVALASNSERYVVDEVLKRIDAVGVFDVVVTGDEVKHYKPHPEIYRTIVKNLGVSPKDAVIFEDSLTGTKAAVDSGTDTIVIWDEEISKVLYPYGVKFFLDDFVGLDEMIEKSPKQMSDEAAKEVVATEQV